MLGVVVWDLKGGGRLFHKSTRLVNKCLLGQAETMGRRVASGLQALPSFATPHPAHILC